MISKISILLIIKRDIENGPTHFAFEVTLMENDIEHGEDNLLRHGHFLYNKSNNQSRKTIKRSTNISHKATKLPREGKVELISELQLALGSELLEQGGDECLGHQTIQKVEHL